MSKKAAINDILPALGGLFLCRAGTQVFFYKKELQGQLCLHIIHLLKANGGG
tara:strand:+ start:391 stop:546 length:156 start_codon:yes stop_codon:yes gene_type:complete